MMIAYGRDWGYGVVIRPNTDPDAPLDQRYLAIHQVYYANNHDSDLRPGDVVCVETEPAEVEGASIPESLLALERMQQAVERPVVIAAEHAGTCEHEHRLAFDDGFLYVTTRSSDPEDHFGLSPRVDHPIGETPRPQPRFGRRAQPADPTERRGSVPGAGGRPDP